MFHSDSVIVPDHRGLPLVGGPQDGSRVTLGSRKLPGVLYVGRKWLGDRFSAWGYERSERFPYCYRYDGRVFMFDGMRE